MANSRTRAKKNRSIIKLQFVVETLRRSLLLGRNLNSDCSDDSTYVPGDVKEDHFAVIAVCGSEVKRFVVALGYLTRPRFLMLLEQAAEVNGINLEGALAIPCPPSKLENILDDDQSQQEEEDSPSSSAGVNWPMFS